MKVIPDVGKIAVLRPNAVGDFVFALPALHALRNAYPDARISYIGKPWHAGFLRNRPGPVDRAVVMPPVPGIGAASDANVDTASVQAFMRAMQEEEFDLAFQLYGGGRYSNPFIKRFGARLTIGLKAADAEPLDRWLPYGSPQNKRLQFLEVAALAGADTLRLGPELHVTACDRREVARIL
ncbi:MAG TPA: glycosyltransferase family 9 protein, partial [Noviherbaspirillum sp.]